MPLDGIRDIAFQWLFTVAENYKGGQVTFTSEIMTNQGYFCIIVCENALIFFYHYKSKQLSIPILEHGKDHSINYDNSSTETSAGYLSPFSIKAYTAVQ